ncbi:MAG: S24 family peptidase [Bacteroidaceae bacterium]|nr:S24 family peptidase [Bacteroidaceae bacterium]
MVTISDVINLSLTKDEILSCLRKTQSIDFLDNLRKRHPNVQFDCKLRGYIGELAIKKWFLQNGIEIEATDYMPDDDSIDIDFVVAGTNIELKTSLIPDKDKDIATVLANRDIKLIRRNNQSIEELKGDVHMQIYYKQKTHAKDEWLSQQDVDLSGNVECLYKQLRADAYLSTTFFVAWIDKPSLIEYIHSLPETKQTWSFANSMREFWRCPLQNSRKPIELIAYFQELIKSYHLPILTYDSIPEEDQFTTYLPLYTIRAACGYFGEGEQVEEEGWINAEGIGRLNRNMFVVRAVGHSMEPRINDGDYCVFQSNPAGSRQGTIVLAQHRGYFDEDNAGAYSIKEYSSEKSVDEYGGWQHEKIILKPYNPAYDPIVLTPDDEEDFRIVGGFVGIIRTPEK